MPDKPAATKLYDINSIVELVDSIELKRPPSLAQYQDMVHYFEEMQQAMQMIQRYKKPDTVWDPETMENDKIYLSSLHASMSQMVGYLQGESARAESARKIAKSRYILEIKKTKSHVTQNKLGYCKLTETEIDNAARVLSINDNEAARSAETVSRILSNAWYAIAGFIEVLKSATYRSNKEERNTS
jgi:hypothetical protein